MLDASYVVIRVIADPARNEPMNVGVLAWAGEQHELTIDRDAVDRVVRNNPALHQDALLGLEEVVRDYLGLDEQPPAGEIRERLQRQMGAPLLWSEPRFTSLASDAPESLHLAVESIVTRVVRPRRRPGGSPPDLLGLLERQIRPLLTTGRVHQNHVFRATSTGVERRVDLFANSGANVALDHVRLQLKRADEIRLRADATANKARDILSRNDVRFVLLASFSGEEELSGANVEARQILSSSHVEVIDTVEAAAALLDRR